MKKHTFTFCERTKANRLHKQTNHSQLVVVFLLVFSLFTLTNANAQGCSQFVKSVPGELLSGQAYGGSNSDNKFGDMVFDIDNNIYITGSSLYFITKYSKEGVLKWNKIKSGKVSVDVEVYNNQYIYATGIGALLCKFDSAGNELFTPINITNAEPTSMCLDASGNVYITGRVIGTAVFGANTYSAGCFIVKYNSSGVLLWSNNIVNSTGYGFPKIISDGVSIYTSMLQAFGQFYTGSFTVSAGTATYTSPANSLIRGALIKIDLNGNTAWIKGTEAIFDMTFNYQGNIMAASENGKCMLFDNTGNLLNSYVYGGGFLALHHIRAFNDKFVCVSNTSADFILVGDFSNTNSNFYTVYTTPSTTNTESHYVLPNFDKNGSLYCAFGIGILSYNSLVDLVPINGFTTKVLLAKYNSDFRLLPEYTSKTMTCGDDSVQLGYDVYYDWNANFFGTTYNWTPSTGLSSSSIQNPKAKPLITTSYTVTVNGTCPTTVNVVVNNSSSFTYSTNGLVASFAIDGIGCNSFVWDFGNGNTSTINPNPIVTYATAGTYGVCLQCNGQPSSCVQCINVTVPSTTDGGVGIEEVKTLGLSVFPNPANDFVTIENKNGTLNSVYFIVNSLGQHVLKGKLVAETTTVDISVLKPGFYTLQIGETEQQLFKLIKK
jgi:hypothetical protein